MHMCPESVLPSTSRMGSVCDADGRAVWVGSEKRRREGTHHHKTTAVYQIYIKTIIFVIIFACIAVYKQNGASNMIRSFV